MGRLSHVLQNLVHNETEGCVRCKTTEQKLPDDLEDTRQMNGTKGRRKFQEMDV